MGKNKSFITLTPEWVERRNVLEGLGEVQEEVGGAGGSTRPGVAVAFVPGKPTRFCSTFTVVSYEFS